MYIKFYSSETKFSSFTSPSFSSKIVIFFSASSNILLHSFEIFIPSSNLDIDSSKFKYRVKTIHATATIGVKEFSSEDDITKIVDEADILMYVGKNNGKNQITVEKVKKKAL